MYNFMAQLTMIGDFQLSDHLIGHSLDKSGALSSEKHFGLLGNNILEMFDVLIDFKTYCLYLRPNAYFDRPFEVPNFCFSFIDRSETYDAWFVTGLYEGIGADNCGLQVDDRPVVNIGFGQRKSLFREAKVIKFTIDKNNEKVEFVIKLKPIV